MTFTELFNANESAQYPAVAAYPTGGYYRIEYHALMRLDEQESALFCARLLALLPARTAGMAIELAEIVRREQEGWTAE